MYSVNRAELSCIGIKLSDSELVGLSRIQYKEKQPIQVLRVG